MQSLRPRCISLLQTQTSQQSMTKRDDKAMQTISSSPRNFTSAELSRNAATNALPPIKCLKVSKATESSCGLLKSQQIKHKILQKHLKTVYKSAESILDKKQSLARQSSTESIFRQNALKAKARENFEQRVIRLIQESSPNRFKSSRQTNTPSKPPAQSQLLMLQREEEYPSVSRLPPRYTNGLVEKYNEAFKIVVRKNRLYRKARREF